MPYTLIKGLVWILLAVLLGIVIGWLLRSVAAKRQVARARAHHVETAELERLRGRVANLEAAAADRERLQAELDALRAPPGAVIAPLEAPPSEPVAPPAPDCELAAAVLGRPIVLDDLTAIDGIGPSVEELLHGIGIRTWFDLSVTEVSLLRTMLADAGARFHTLDPAGWPHQAELLAAGRWAEFRALAEAARDEDADVAGSGG